MRRQIYIFILFIGLFGCIGKNRYFEPEGIVDKTEEYVKDNKSWTKLEDKVSVDGYTRIGDSIFGGEIACNVEPLENIDVRPLKYCQEQSTLVTKIISTTPWLYHVSTTQTAECVFMPK